MTASGAKSTYRWFTHALLPLFLAVFLIIPFVLPHWILGAGWWREFFDLAHFLSFALLAALGILLFKPFQENGLLKAVALGATIVLLSTTTELIQHFYHADRSGSVADVVRNCLGALAFAAASAAFYIRFPASFRAFLLLIAVALLIWAFTPLIKQWGWQQKREQQLPVLYDFDEHWEGQQVSWTHAMPIEEAEWGGSRKPTLICPEETWSGIRIKRVWPHWKTFEQLNLSLTADMEIDSMPLQLYVGFVDNFRQQKLHWGIAYTEVDRGENTLVIPFESIFLEEKTINFDDVRVQFLDIYKPEGQPPLKLSIQKISLATVHK